MGKDAKVKTCEIVICFCLRGLYFWKILWFSEREFKMFQPLKKYKIYL